MTAPFVRIDSAMLTRLLAEADGAAIRVFLALVIHGDANCRCWPGVGRLAAMTGLSTRWVRASIQRLELLGIISVERHRGQGNAYTLPPVGGAESQCPTPELSTERAFPSYGKSDSPGEALQAPQVRKRGSPERDLRNQNHERDVTLRPVSFPGIEDQAFWRSVTSLARKTANALAGRMQRRLTADDRDFILRSSAFAVWGAGESWLLAALHTTLERPRDNTVAYLRGTAARMAWNTEGRTPAADDAPREVVLRWFARELRGIEIPVEALPKPTMPRAVHADPIREAAAADPWTREHSAAVRRAALAGTSPGPEAG